MTEWSNLAKIIYRRTYARQDTGKLETWPETVERVIQGNTRLTEVSEAEKNRLRYFMLNRKAIPAGRGLWFSGSPANDRIGGKALNNCWFLDSSDWHNFVLAQDLLMTGGGVGLSVEHKYTSKLPKVKRDVTIKHQPSADADFIVPDSREGWCELTRRILESYFSTGRSFSYSTVVVRGAGEAIRGFGGVASGPIPLIKFITNLCNIIGSRSGKHIRPIDAADIICATGEMVVAGNVRRSAIIIIGDCWDKEYLLAKRWDLGILPTYRSCANYSIVCDDIEDVHPSFWKTYEHGEPFGIVNLKNIRKYGRLGEVQSDTATGVNPCQPGWASVITPDGIKTIDDISIGSIIWSGKQWTKVTNKVYTGQKPIYQYRTSAGLFIGTPGHKIIRRGKRIEVDAAAAIDIAVGPYEYVPGINQQDVIDGLVYGDGSFHKASNKLVLYIGDNDHDYFNDPVSTMIGAQNKVGKKTWDITTTLTQEDLPHIALRVVPKRFVKGSKQKIKGFLRGLYSANGSICGGRVTLKASSFATINLVQQMLSYLGIKSYYTKNKPSSVVFANGEYVCKESYDLNISTDRHKFADMIGFIQSYKNDRLKPYLAKSIRKSKETFNINSKEYFGIQAVYDLTVEADEHTYWTGCLLVSNCAEATLECYEPCNLQEIALMNIDSEEEFIEAARLMHRYGKRVTLENYYDKNINEVVQRNRRIGTGITGCLGSPLFTYDKLSRVYQAIAIENENYSRLLNIPKSIRTTVVKPSGTVSKLLDQRGYEGIHPAFSQYMIQRVRFSSNDLLIASLREAGHHIEPQIKFDGSIDPNTLVVDFYQQAPKGLPVADQDWDTFKQLDTLLLAQQAWADQAVSVTVYYKKEDLAKLKAWLQDNLCNIKTISFLCHSDHGFKQAPKEAINQETYDKLSSKIKPLEIDQVTYGDLDNMECEGGVCPIK